MLSQAQKDACFERVSYLRANPKDAINLYITNLVVKLGKDEAIKLLQTELDYWK